MRLADFILANVEPILTEWDSFARTIFPDAKTDVKTLRNHSERILRAAVQDMKSAQSEIQRGSKSRGDLSTNDADDLNEASRSHGVERLDSGFDLLELFSEYRALRATTLRLWAASVPSQETEDIDDITRFNEAIDQSIARSLRSYTEKVDSSRDMFLAILGHDLRNPLNSIAMSAQVLPRICKLEDVALKYTTQITDSAKVMEKLISDVLEFTRSRLGGGMPIAHTPMDLGVLIREVLAEFQAAHPLVTITLDVKGDLTGAWDDERLRQVVSNLLGNAVQHGDRNAPIAVRLTSDATTVSCSVNNGGVIRSTGALATIFEPLKRGVSSSATHSSRAGSIGLGLYIARELVVAHGGTIDVTSTQAAGTTFTFHLPRAATAPAEA